MGVRIALCQLRACEGEVGTNLDRIMSVITQTKADVYIFPELFLCGYNADYASCKNQVGYALDKITLWCSENDIAIVLGAPTYIGDTIRNSLYFITQKKIYRYDKLYLANFGMYDESAFTQGNKPVIAEFKGMKFGLSICYDAFFPEIYRFYAVKEADINICISASAATSKEFFDYILPARSVENVLYTVYVNCIGKYKTSNFYGHSRLIGPLGNTLGEADSSENIMCLYADKSVIERSREIRKQISDLRNDIDWHI